MERQIEGFILARMNRYSRAFALAAGDWAAKACERLGCYARGEKFWSAIISCDYALNSIQHHRSVPRWRYDVVANNIPITASIQSNCEKYPPKLCAAQ